MKSSGDIEFLIKQYFSEREILNVDYHVLWQIRIIRRNNWEMPIIQRVSGVIVGKVISIYHGEKDTTFFVF